MPRSRKPNLTKVKSIAYQPLENNSISLRDDEFLDEHLKPIRVGDRNTCLQLSDNGLRVDGDLFLNGKFSSHTLETTNKYFDFVTASGISTNPYWRFSGGTIEDNEALELYGSDGTAWFFNALNGDSYGFNLKGSGDPRSIYFSDSGNTKFNFTLYNTSAGSKTALAITSHDGGETSTISVDNDGETTLDSEEKIYLKPTTELKSDAPLKIKESADAVADTAGYGQLWVDTATPNELAFTDDAGTDIIGIGKYHYETKFIAFYSGATANYLPMNGYILEQTSTTGKNEYIAFLAPYNGRIEKVGYRSEIAQDGSLSLRILEATDGTEVPGLLIFRKETTVDIADDTYQELDMTSPGTGSDYSPLTKGRIYVIYLATPSIGYDTNVNVVFRWDITS